MGPLQDRADDSIRPCRDCRHLTLQWGRSKTERMTVSRVDDDVTPARLQWGRSKTERMTRRGEASRSGVAAVASMGPLQDRADDGDCRRSPTLHSGASMGPLQDRADDSLVGRVCHSGYLRLQWGRSKTERMTSFPAGAPGRRHARLQWGRSKTERMTGCRTAAQPLRSPRFNGAAPRQSG